LFYIAQACHVSVQDPSPHSNPTPKKKKKEKKENTKGGSQGTSNNAFTTTE